MDTQTIRATADIYDLVRRIKVECNKNGLGDLTAQFDEALHLGSSALEILGAIRKIFVDNRAEIEQLLGRNGKKEVDSVVAFVDRAFGR